MVRAGRVNSMLITDNFPEFGSDLVTALSGLDVDDFSHCEFVSWLVDCCRRVSSLEVAGRLSSFGAGVLVCSSVLGWLRSSRHTAPAGKEDHAVVQRLMFGKPGYPW